MEQCYIKIFKLFKRECKMQKMINNCRDMFKGKTMSMEAADTK